MIYCARESGARSTMTAPILILILYAATKPCGAEVKPVVTFRPNWKMIFPYESVTMSCDVGSMAQRNPRYFWSKDGKPLSGHQQMFKIEGASKEDIGSYQCWANADLKSDPVRLDVVGTPLILQTPPVIYLGEPLTLRCHSFPGYQRTNTTFLKNKTVIHFSVNDNELRFASVDSNMAGSYSCSQPLLLHGKCKTFNATTMVSVQERPHSSLDGRTPMSPWILVVVPILLISAALLIFKWRHKLGIRGRHQQHTLTGAKLSSPDTELSFLAATHTAIAETERKGGSEEDDLCYTYILTNNLYRGVPAQEPDSHDYSSVYSLVTGAPPAVGIVEETDSSLTNTERKGGSEEEDLCYTFIHMNNLQRGVPAQEPDSHDYSSIYSLVTGAPPAVSAVEETDSSLTS